MKKIRQKILGTGLCVAAICAPALRAQDPAKAQTPRGAAETGRVQNSRELSVSVDGREAMFTTMCALLASGYESDVNADNWPTFRPQMLQKDQHQEGGAVDAVREFFKQH